MSNSITAMPTASLMQAKANRETAAAVAAQTTAAHAVAEMARIARGNLFRAIASAPHGLVFEECVAALQCEELARTLLQAMAQDHEISERQGVYSVTFKGAA